MSGLKPSTVGPFCGEVRPSQRGRNWHRRRGERACVTCHDSVGVYQRFWRLQRGRTVNVTREELESFALAWDPSLSPDRAFHKAASAMIVGVG